jgi:hypothetical protein
MKAFLLVFTVLTIPVVYQMIPTFFSSYDSTTWIRGIRGPFISFIIILITMSSMYLSQKKPLRLMNVFTIAALFFSFLNLSNGNRGYFITFIVSIIVVISQSRGGIKYRNIILFTLFGMILAGIVGSLRSPAEVGIGIDNIIFHVFAEENNVATSLIMYLSQSSEELIEFPTSFLTQFINIIPSIIFPSKFEFFILDPRVPYYLASSHLYVLLMTNFGLIGSILFMYFFVYILNVIKVKYRFVGIYPALCAYIPFMFFRDFELTVVKFMLEFTFLYAVIIMLVGNTIRLSTRQKKSYKPKVTE